MSWPTPRLTPFPRALRVRSTQGNISQSLRVLELFLLNKNFSITCPIGPGGNRLIHILRNGSSMHNSATDLQPRTRQRT